MMKSLRVSYWMLSGFLKKHKRILLLGIVLGISIMVLLPRINNLLPEPTRREKIAVIGNPTLSEIPRFIQEQISFGLTAITPSGEATPAAAQSFRVEDDGKRYVFKLRHDLNWHDGKSFTAEDVNYNFEDVEIKLQSQDEIVFQLKEPFAPFPTIVSQPLFRQERSKLLRGNLSLLGLGEAKVIKLTHSSQGSQKINELVLQMDEGIRSYRFYNTQEAAITAFKLGEINTILELSSPGELASWPTTIVEENVHSDRYVALFFNTQNEFLGSKNFRKALTYAVPTKPINELRAISPINPNSWAYNPQVRTYEFDLEAAKNLLDQEKEENENFDPVIELTTTLPHLDTAELIREQWELLGIRTAIKVVTYLPEEMQVLLIAQEIPADPDQYSFWHSTQPTNFTKYNSPKVDKLLEDGRQTLDQQERTLLYQDFQRFLVEDAPAAFLYHHRTYSVSRQ